jgi:hypothetical protein
MGEAKRRGKGGECVSDLVIVRPLEVPRVLMAADGGDKHAILILHGLGQAFSQIREKGRTIAPALCVTCDHGFAADEMPGAVVLQIPWGQSTGAEGEMIVSACCKACVGMSDTSLAKSVLKMIQSYAPDTRVLEMREAAGSLQ